MKENSSFLEELTLEGLKNQAHIHSLINILTLSTSLQYVNLRDNVISSMAAVELTKFLKETNTLQFLNISGCQISVSSAATISDGILLNRSIQYLNISQNNFSSRDYSTAAKLGRIAQGHPSLLHIDYSHLNLQREECLYIVICVRDSKNVQGIHLTGNRFNYYDRLLMRAMIPCKVKWPTPPSTI